MGILSHPTANQGAAESGHPPLCCPGQANAQYWPPHTPLALGFTSGGPSGESAWVGFAFGALAIRAAWVNSARCAFVCLLSYE